MRCHFKFFFSFISRTNSWLRLSYLGYMRPWSYNWVLYYLLLFEMSDAHQIVFKDELYATVDFVL